MFITSRISMINNLLSILHFTPSVHSSGYYMVFRNSIPMYYLTFTLLAKDSDYTVDELIVQSATILKEILGYDVEIKWYAYDIDTQELELRFLI